MTNTTTLRSDRIAQIVARRARAATGFFAGQATFASYRAWKTAMERAEAVEMAELVAIVRGPAAEQADEAPVAMAA